MYNSYCYFAVLLTVFWILFLQMFCLFDLHFQVFCVVPIILLILINVKFLLHYFFIKKCSLSNIFFSMEKLLPTVLILCPFYFFICCRMDFRDLAFHFSFIYVFSPTLGIFIVRTSDVVLSP